MGWGMVAMGWWMTHSPMGWTGRFVFPMVRLFGSVFSRAIRIVGRIDGSGFFSRSGFRFLNMAGLRKGFVRSYRPMGGSWRGMRFGRRFIDGRLRGNMRVQRSGSDAGFLRGAMRGSRTGIRRNGRGRRNRGRSLGFLDQAVFVPCRGDRDDGYRRRRLDGLVGRLLMDESIFVPCRSRIGRSFRECRGVGAQDGGRENHQVKIVHGDAIINHFRPVGRV